MCESPVGIGVDLGLVDLIVATVAAMDKAWTLGVGQQRDWWAGTWDDDRPANDQPGMAQLFRLNERWPYPLMPSEYVKRQVHVSFQEDPMAIACRHLTGISTLVWGADYPHAEGTFTRTREAIEYQFRDVDPVSRTAILGGTLGGCSASRPEPRLTRGDADYGHRVGGSDRLAASALEEDVDACNRHQCEPSGR